MAKNGILGLVLRVRVYLAIALAVLVGTWLLQMGIGRAEERNPGEQLFRAVVERVEEDFVGEVDTELLYRAAIEALLGELDDPYSSYVPARAYENMRIQTEGDYGGLGLEIVNRAAGVTVVHTIPGTPGHRAGIREGDSFFEIDGIRADTLRTEQTAILLRGRPGSSVHVRMLRPGIEHPIDFEIERATIRLRAVPFGLLLDGIAYVPLETFRETATREIGEAIDSLAAAARDSGLPGLKGLVLDLRDNPGGLLNEGVKATDLFLDEGLGVVETRARNGRGNVTYAATSRDRYPELPMVVLVNGSSASASEILAGALQDHDRALVLGETTFGKGSVQTYYSFPQGDALRLTTASWYTPAGRSISRFFDEAETAGGDAAETEIGDAPEDQVAEDDGGWTERLTIGGRRVAPVDTAGRPRFESTSGRMLYGGGGVVPDRFVLPELLLPDEEKGLREIALLGGRYAAESFDFAVTYVRDNPGLEVGFDLSEEDLDEFVARLVELDETIDLVTVSGARRFFRYGLEREIAQQAFGDKGALLQVMEFDRQLAAALDILAESG
ncbi:MAG: S41 family peptidase [Gemmatimonadetes bacterium]|nr:S41 family peptidase [Gemmatimonadota bacterium]